MQHKPTPAPTPDARRSDRDLAAAFKNLESTVCDLAASASILAHFVGEDLVGLRPDQCPGLRAPAGMHLVLLSEEQMCALTYIAFNTVGLAQDLKKEWYSHFDNGGAA